MVDWDQSEKPEGAKMVENTPAESTLCHWPQGTLSWKTLIAKKTTNNSARYNDFRVDGTSIIV